MEKIVKKSSFLISTQLITKGISFLYTLFLLRFLNPEDFGVYIVALSYFSLVSSISDFGISRFFVREVSKEQRDIPEFVTSIVFIRLAVLLIVCFVFSVLLFSLDPNRLRSLLSILAILAIIPGAVSWTVNDAFLATSRTKLYALGGLILNLAATLAGVLLVFLGFSVVGVVLAILVGQYIYALYSLIIFISQKIGFSNRFKRELIKEIAVGALPYGVLSILGLIYFKIDSIMLSYMKGSFEAGIYGAAYRFLEAIVFIPTSVSLIVFPLMSKWHDLDFLKVKVLSKRIVRVMGVLGVGVMVGYIFALPPLIKVFFPNYNSSIQVVQILALSIPFMFIHVPLSQALLSSDRYLKQIISLSVITVSFNVLFNFLFIPKYGYVAASWVTVFSDVFSLALLMLVMRKFLFKDGKAWS